MSRLHRECRQFDPVIAHQYHLGENMISVSINVSDSRFFWYLDLSWFAHSELYKNEASEKLYSAIICDGKKEEIQFPIKYKHCHSFKNDNKIFNKIKHKNNPEPINVQVALSQILNEFHDDTVIELIDHDMFHFRPHPKIEINHDEFIVCDLYEKWHLHSLTSNKHVISQFLGSDDPVSFYNGGHVPIIGTVKTFKKILDDWIRIHISILRKEKGDTQESNDICWWAGMYSFNAVCEIHKIKMIAKNYCYIPDANSLTDEMYIGHFSVDKRFNKRNYPFIYEQDFLENDYYHMIKRWNHNMIIERWKRI